MIQSDVCVARVGSGPFPTEIDDENGKKLQEIGGEWGVSTGSFWLMECSWVISYHLQADGEDVVG